MANLVFFIINFLFLLNWKLLKRLFKFTILFIILIQFPFQGPKLYFQMFDILNLIIGIERYYHFFFPVLLVLL